MMRRRFGNRLQLRAGRDVCGDDAVPSPIALERGAVGLKVDNARTRNQQSSRRNGCTYHHWQFLARISKSRANRNTSIRIKMTPRMAILHRRYLVSERSIMSHMPSHIVIIGHRHSRHHHAINHRLIFV